jgi:hypothetical protein
MFGRERERHIDNETENVHDDSIGNGVNRTEQHRRDDHDHDHDDGERDKVHSMQGMKKLTFVFATGGRGGREGKACLPLPERPTRSQK